MPPQTRRWAAPSPLTRLTSLACGRRRAPAWSETPSQRADSTSSLWHGATMSERRLTIDGVEIHDGGACYVIAEVGHNHQGDLQQAKDLIDAAKDCGANAVKLQKRANRSLYTREF